MTDQSKELERLRHDRLDCQLVMDCQQAEIERLRRLVSDMADALEFILEVYDRHYDHEPKIAERARLELNSHEQGAQEKS